MTERRYVLNRCPACGVLCGVKVIQDRRYFRVHGPGREENCVGSLQPVRSGTRGERLLAIALDIAKDYAVYDHTKFDLVPKVPEPTPLEEFNAEVDSNALGIDLAALIASAETPWVHIKDLQNLLERRKAS